MKKIITIILIIIELMSILLNFNIVQANIKEGDTVLLKGDHECDSLLEYWMTDYNRWSYKVVWYVYYIDLQTGNKYPAFCIEPAKEGVGTGYDQYNTTIRKENDNCIWRILSKGYMGSNYEKWGLECDDDLYTATKVALHSYVEKISPKDKYIIGNRAVDGNSVEEIQRRGTKVLEVSQILYEYGIYGKEEYKSPQINISKDGTSKIEIIDGEEYYIQNYKVISNKTLQSYKIEIENFVNGTKILESNSQEKFNFNNPYFKIAIPTKNINKTIKGKINIKEAQIKTCPIFYANSSIQNAQSYVTYTSSNEEISNSIGLTVEANNSNLKITKIDSETKKPLENVTFKIMNQNEEDIGEYTTNDKGIIELEHLLPGLIKIKEIKVDDKYILNGEEKEVFLQWGKTTNVEIENNRKKGNLKIIKSDVNNTNTKLEGVEFELYNYKKELIRKLVTDKNGEIIVEKLDIGEYILKEIKTNEKYILNKDEVKLEIKWNEELKLEIKNEKIKGQIKIIKVSEDDNKINGKKAGSPILGVEFEIRDVEGNLVEKVNTNEEGIAISAKLEKGQYIIKETKTDENYELNEAENKIEITTNEEIVELHIKNKSKNKLPRTGF